MATFVEPRGLDPKTAASSGRTGAIELAALYDTLMSYDPRSGEYQPHLAESLTADESLTTWTLALRPGITFSNGNPLDAAAVIASIERHQADDARLSSNTADITSMAMSDDTTVEFTLARAWPEFPALLAGPVGMIVDTTVVDAMGEEAFQSDPDGAGAGPFVLQSYAPGESVVMTARDGYWGGEVCTATLRFASFSDASGAYDAFQNDEFDVAFITDPVVADAAREDGADTFAFTYGLGRAVVINAGAKGSTPPTADVRLRRAIALGVDPDFVNERAAQGKARAGSMIFDADMISNPGVPGPAFDPDAARALVDEVKADTGFDGSLRLLCPEIPISQESGIAIKSLLENIGLQIDLQIVDTTTLTTAVISDANFDLACWQFSVSDNDPLAALEAFASDSGSNRGGYSDPAMDTALDELRTASDADARQQALADVQTAWNDTVPAITLGAAQDVIISHDVSGLQFSVDSIVLLAHAAAS